MLCHNFSRFLLFIFSHNEFTLRPCTIANVVANPTIDLSAQTGSILRDKQGN